MLGSAIKLGRYTFPHELVGLKLREKCNPAALYFRYMVQMEIPEQLDQKVRRYLVETYATKKTLVEEAVLGILPNNDREDVLACETRDVGIKL